jgi:NitT/TauT family transport system substrate-binding protein
MVPEVDAATAAKQWTASIPLIVNEISKKDGLGAFEPKLLAKTWVWVAKAQNIPVDKFDPEKAIDRSFLK